MNGVQLNGVLNAVHLLLNAELNAAFISELNAELNVGKFFTERLLNAAFRVGVQFRLVFSY